MNKVIYTAAFGGKDTVVAAPKIPGVDFIAFTDDAKCIGKGWEPIVSNAAINPRLNAKVFKILPHYHLPQYDESIWMDANMQLRGDPSGLFALLKDNHIGFFEHHQTGCIYEQAKLCVKYNKAKSEDLKAQTDYYEDMGYPHGIEGVACYVIFRRHNQPEVVAAMDDWMQQIREWTIRDQISFPYVAWKRGLPFTRLNKDLFQFYFLRHKHKRNG